MQSPPRASCVLLIRGTTVLQVFDLHLVLIYQHSTNSDSKKNLTRTHPGGVKVRGRISQAENVQKQLSLLSITQCSCVCSPRDLKAQLAKTFLGGKTFLWCLEKKNMFCSSHSTLKLN